MASGTRYVDERQHHNAEGIRAYEVRRLISKLSLSQEQTEIIENLSRSLVAELVHGPIVETVARVQLPSELAASEERLLGREEVLRSPGAVAPAL